MNVKDVMWIKRNVADDYYDAVAKGYETFTAQHIESDNGN